ncbi:MAG: radical SAM protein [Lachnospiraceae bacterium]|nr:radical SAM protein [Lachnospiraceae bacterium]
MFKERLKTHHSAMSEGKKYVAGMGTPHTALMSVNENDSKLATIYIHVPFCNKICSFCNMRRSLQNPAENYADLVVREIEQYAALPYIETTTFDAVYFGGGTPTTLSGEALSKILKALKGNLNFTEDAEFTIETTVTELTEDKMKTLIENGVNRFSVGVQTFDDEGRKQMGRIGSGETAYERLKQLKSYDGVTVSMDLIYNYPGQTMESLMADLDKITELNLDGFSMYSLINMKETTIDNAGNERNDEEMFYTISHTMKERGYDFLELTKMVKSDRYRYIMNRHKGADTLPLGAGAGGSVNGLALMNPIKLDEYEQSVSDLASRKGMLFVPEYVEVVRFKGDVQTAYLPRNEAMYGSNLGEYERFRRELIEQDMVCETADGYRLTEKGIFWGNTISRHLSQMVG